MRATSAPTHGHTTSSNSDRAPAAAQRVPSSKARVWSGRAMSGLVAAFLLFDSAIKVLELVPAKESTQQLGYSASALFAIGLIELSCTLLYLVPRLSVFGAVLLTGYLGGAVATHVRVDNPLFSHTLFPIYVAVLVWGGLALRDRRVRALIAPVA